MQVVYRSLQKHGFSVLALHGDLDQRMRMAALDAFRADEVQLLVCSDVAARGLDIPDVSHVINYDAPHHAEDYVHRIGRTGRAGKTGVALTIVSRADQKAIAEIEKLIARKIDWQDGAQLPPDDEVEAAPRRERSPVAAAPASATSARRRSKGASVRTGTPITRRIRVATAPSAPRANASPRIRSEPRLRGGRSGPQRPALQRSPIPHRGANVRAATSRRRSSGSATMCPTSSCAR